MSNPIVSDTKPSVVDLKAGETYFFCRCGKSASQPFCDGAHQGTEFSPLPFTPEEDRKAALCQCKQTGNAPFCDGTHNGIPADQVGKEFSAG